MSDPNDTLKQLVEGLTSLVEQVEQNRVAIASIRGEESTPKKMIEKLSSFSSSFTSRSDKEKELEREKSRLERENRSLQSAHDSLQRKVERLEKEAESSWSLKQQINALSNDKQYLSHQNQELQRHLKQQVQELNKAKQREAQLQKELDEMPLEDVEKTVAQWFNRHPKVYPNKAGQSIPNTFVGKMLHLLTDGGMENLYLKLLHALGQDASQFTPSEIHTVWQYLVEQHSQHQANWTLSSPTVGSVYDGELQNSLDKAQGQITTVWVPEIRIRTRQGELNTLRAIVSVD